ncbi:MAG: radical SAM protein, partial [Candidatus Caldatribacteriaceae bacterium]
MRSTDHSSKDNGFFVKTSSEKYKDKIVLLGEGARFDLCGSCFEEELRKKSPLGRWIYPVVLPDGKRIRLFKILLSNHCIHNCLYCVNRWEREKTVAFFRAEELARLFVSLYNQGRVQGLFLSSAVAGDPARTMTEMIKVVEILRFKARFRGYIHLKILPEVETDFVEEAACLATRVSVNLEAPTPSTLFRIAPEKNYESIWKNLVF